MGKYVTNTQTDGPMHVVKEVGERGNEGRICKRMAMAQGLGGSRLQIIVITHKVRHEQSDVLGMSSTDSAQGQHVHAPYLPQERECERDLRRTFAQARNGRHARLETLDCAEKQDI